MRKYKFNQIEVEVLVMKTKCNITNSQFGYDKKTVDYETISVTWKSFISQFLCFNYFPVF